jgi:hypothetical protein
MVALAATNVTVTISQRNVEDRPGLLRHVVADLTFGTGALTYPAGGVPLPAIGQFGFRKAIAIGLVEPPTDELYHWVYDRTNHTLMATGVSELSGHAPVQGGGATRFYEVPTTYAPASTTIRVMFFGE